MSLLNRILYIFNTYTKKALGSRTALIYNNNTKKAYTMDHILASTYIYIHFHREKHMIVVDIHLIRISIPTHNFIQRYYTYTEVIYVRGVRPAGASFHCIFNINKIWEASVNIV